MAQLDPKYEDFFRKWKTRIGGTNRDLAESFMRGEALDTAGYPTLPDEKGKTGIFVRVDGRGVDAVADPEAIEDMLAEWEHMVLEMLPDERRPFTKNFITQCVASNRHTEEVGVLLLSAAVWLAAGSTGLMDSLKRGDCGLLCELTFDDENRSRRLQLSLLA